MSAPEALLAALATIAVFGAVAVVFVLILTVCSDLIAHWRGEDS